MKTIYTLFIALLLLAGCHTEEIEKYNHVNYIYLANLNESMLEYSFSFHPGKNSDTIPIVIKLIGDISDHDRPISLVVEASKTTALETDYTLPEHIVLRAGHFTDTIPFVLHKTARLQANKYTIRLEIKDSELLKRGPASNRYIDIRFSDMISRPVWWNDEMVNNWLGTYSDIKYRLFIEATGIVDMTGLTDSEVRAYAVMFRDFLDKSKEQGHKYEDENGVVTVPVRLFS